MVRSYLETGLNMMLLRGAHTGIGWALKAINWCKVGGLVETPGDGRDWRDVFLSPRMLKIESTTHRAREKDHHDSQREDAPANTFLSGF